MKVTQVLILVLVLSVGTALAAQNPNPDITRRELQNFDNFLDTHPAVDRELTNNPRLIEDPAYIAAHPELKTFLADHPGVREEMKETPRFFMHREEQFDKSGRDITHREAASLDVFLDAHPGVEKELRKDPSLVKNPGFLAMHPEFSEYLSKHPAVKADLAENPKAFMKREAQYERNEKKEIREEKHEAHVAAQPRQAAASTAPKPAH
jgi:phage-related protein